VSAIKRFTGDVIFVGNADGSQPVARHRLDHVTYYLLLVKTSERLNGTSAVHNPRTPAINTHKNTDNFEVRTYLPIFTPG